MIQNMPKASIMIPAGGMYYEWSCLMDLVEVDKSVPETDLLVLIDDNYLVRLHKGNVILN